MYPCSACHRHLRDADRSCPFCGAVQSTATLPVADMLGAFSLALLLLGATACSPDTVSVTTASESGSTSTSTTTTVSDTSDSNQDTSTSTDTSDTVDDTTLSSGAFYGGATDWVGPSECDPFLQDCPEDEKCVPYSTTSGNFDANRCVPILGDGEPGDPCIYAGNNESTDDCNAESFCWDTTYINGEQVGVCTAYCDGTADDPICPADTVCFIAYEGSTNLCLSPCNPVMQDCAPGSACYWSGGVFVCLPTAQDVPLGEPCGFLNDCAGGHACMPVDVLPSCAGTACCASYCSVMAAEPCAEVGTECMAFFEEGMALPGYEDVGVCMLPGA
jgi:hypothetical protein